MRLIFLRRIERILKSVEIIGELLKDPSPVMEAIEAMQVDIEPVKSCKKHRESLKNLKTSFRRP